MYSDIPIIGGGNSDSTEILSIDELDLSKFYHVKVLSSSSAKSVQTLISAMNRSGVKGLITDEKVTFEEFEKLLKSFTPEQSAKVYDLLYSQSNLVNLAQHELTK